MPATAPTDALTAQWALTPEAQVEAALARQYGLVGRITRLTSERDETFVLAPDAGGPRYTVKLANPAEDPEALAFQAGALQHLAREAPAVPVPQVVTARDGGVSATMPDVASGAPRILRVLTFLEGEPLHRTPPSPGQGRALGAALAGLAQGLAGFAGRPPEGKLLWDISHTLDLADRVAAVDPRWRDLAQAALDQFAQVALPAMACLPRQVIHNDFNPYNLLVAPGAPERITGIIDFGDMVEAPRLNDLAVAAAYHFDRAEWPALAGAVIAGYHARLPLSAQDQRLLPALIGARLAMSVIIAEWRAALMPDHRAYILRNHPRALAGLRHLAELGAAEQVAFVQAQCPASEV